MNKLNTKVEIRFDLDDAVWLGDDEIRKRLCAQRPAHVTQSGEFIVTSQRHRTREQNEADALEKLQLWVDQAAEAPKPRLETKPPGWAKEERIKEKKRRSDVKKSRNKSSWE